MTREDAITIFKRQKKLCLHENDWFHALELAIKALKQETDAIHNEREQAYMKGYEDASKRYRTEPCEDAISRTDAIRIASGYCHWTNIPDELAKLPSVNPIPCEDAISRKAVFEGLARIAKAKARSDAQKSLMGRVMFFTEQLPSVSTEKTGRWIPVSERLPDIHDYCMKYLVTDCHRHIHTSLFTESRGKCWWSHEDVIAWMPLPTSYQGEENV